MVRPEAVRACSTGRPIVSTALALDPNAGAPPTYAILVTGRGCYRTCIPPSRSNDPSPVVRHPSASPDRRIAFFARSDADGVHDGNDEDLAVADLAGAGGVGDRLRDRLCLIVRH